MLPSATRRVIPTGYIVCNLQLLGRSPLLMSSGEADRESDTYQAYRSLTKQRNKTIEQEARIRELEWHLRLYYDDEIGCYIPSKNIKELLRSAATKWRLGEEVKRSLVIPLYRIPLKYEGPRVPSELWKAGFRYTTLVSNAGAGSGRVDRTRPCFDNWSLDCEVAFDPEDLDAQRIVEIVERSQKYGLGDYRPEFGSFAACLTFLREERSGTGANASKARNNRDEKALASMVARIQSDKV